MIIVGYQALGLSGSLGNLVGKMVQSLVEVWGAVPIVSGLVPPRASAFISKELPSGG